MKNLEYPKKDDLKAVRESDSVCLNQKSVTPYSRAVVDLLVSSTFFTKIYLDALPGMIERGVKLYMIGGGKLLGEASGPDEMLMEELDRDCGVKHGEEFWKQFLDQVEWGTPDPDDLKRYRYYYHPEEEQKNP